MGDTPMTRLRDTLRGVMGPVAGNEVAALIEAKGWDWLINAAKPDVVALLAGSIWGAGVPSKVVGMPFKVAGMLETLITSVNGGVDFGFPDILIPEDTGKLRPRGVNNAIAPLNPGLAARLANFDVTTGFSLAPETLELQGTYTQENLLPVSKKTEIIWLELGRLVTRCGISMTPTQAGDLAALLCDVVPENALGAQSSKKEAVKWCAPPAALRPPRARAHPTSPLPRPAHVPQEDIDQSAQSTCSQVRPA